MALILHRFVLPFEIVERSLEGVHFLNLAINLVLALIALGLGNHCFMTQALELLFDEIKPLGQARGATGDHRAMVVYS